MPQSDILVLGAGVAGLSFAINVAEKRPDLKITVVTKTVEMESNTHYAQGGVAAVWDLSKDNFKKHIEDTLDAGDGLCDLNAVKIVVEEGPQRVREIIDWGARFDKEKDGDYDLGREGGHSENRILHYKDLTGWEIQRALIARAKSFENVEILENYFVIDLLTQHHLGYTVTRVTPGITCYGAYILDKATSEIDTCLARSTLRASGGAGQGDEDTPDPTVATGDGIGMVYRAKGRVDNMEVVQFHPTALFNPAGENPHFPISEAVRGEGAILKTEDG